MPKEKKQKFTKGSIDTLFETLGYRKNTKELFDQSESKQSVRIPDQSEREMDFHGMKFVQVKEWLFCEMVDYFHAGFDAFVLIHGFKHGNVIRTYLRTQFQQDFETRFKDLQLSIYPQEKGVTKVLIRN